MDVIINNTYSNTNVWINEENSFLVATSKRALAERARREREKRNKTATFHLQMENNIHRDVHFNRDTSTQQYSRCQEGRNEANAPHASSMNDVNNHWNTLENAGENPEASGVAPSEILGINETTDNSTRLRSRIFEIRESSRVSIDMKYGYRMFFMPLHSLDKKLTKSSRYWPLFGTCYKQGKIRLPILHPLPPAIQVLYDDDSLHATTFKSHIREYNVANAFTTPEVKLGDRILNCRGPKPFSIYGELKH
ncbi:hypothetical protein GIB67_004669 [Kingdonia uniflora]|uniref:Uncharacterized protein n=1 Tax=Kingdonia uniflora TaxID=39325 RepID=A0A7J7P4V2_9MAGN|nr:hypothetical protein GIB67_004669 [Kingdonia uniflora]